MAFQVNAAKGDTVTIFGAAAGGNTLGSNPLYS